MGNNRLQSPAFAQPCSERGDAETTLGKVERNRSAKRTIAEDLFFLSERLFEHRVATVFLPTLTSPASAVRPCRPSCRQAYPVESLRASCLTPLASARGASRRCRSEERRVGNGA